MTTASSPDPVDWTSRFQPGEGTNESIEKPAGGVNSTLVVVAPSSSVGTARLKTWPCFVDDDRRADVRVRRRARSDDERGSGGGQPDERRAAGLVQ